MALGMNHEKIGRIVVGRVEVYMVDVMNELDSEKQFVIV